MVFCFSEFNVQQLFLNRYNESYYQPRPKIDPERFLLTSDYNQWSGEEIEAFLEHKE